MSNTKKNERHKRKPNVDYITGLKSRLGSVGVPSSVLDSVFLSTRTQSENVRAWISWLRDMADPIPTKDEINSALRFQLIDWAEQEGLEVVSTGANPDRPLVEDYREALIEHWH